jgi:drug/metabolite transporter (DMT)-like permease
MLVKRVALLIISLIIGYAITYLIVVLLGTSVEEFWMGPEEPVSIPYFLLVGFFIALAASIWLDKLMRTEILPK